jgi:hypothetical protein
MVQDKEKRYLRERSKEKTTVFDRDIIPAPVRGRGCGTIRISEKNRYSYLIPHEPYHHG